MERIGSIEVERVREAGRLALRVVKSAGKLGGGIGVAGFGGLMAAFSVMQVRLPDSVLLQSAIESAHRMPPSIVDERDGLLIVLGLGVLFLLGGLGMISEWWKAPLGKPDGKNSGSK